MPRPGYYRRILSYLSEKCCATYEELSKNLNIPRTHIKTYVYRMIYRDMIAVKIERNGKTYVCLKLCREEVII